MLILETNIMHQDHIIISNVFGNLRFSNRVKNIKHILFFIVNILNSILPTQMSFFIYK